MLRGFRLPLDALELPHEAVAGLMRLWPKVHWAGGDGMMPPEQLLALYRLAAGWPGEGDVVELGSWVGLTTCYLGTACEVLGCGVVHAVDTFAGTREGGGTYRSVQRHAGDTYAAFSENVSKAGLSRLVRTHRGLTTEVARRYDGKPIRFLLIDADHSYEGVLADVAAWSRHMAAGGLMVFHDYLMRDVARAVNETIARDDRVSASPGLVDPNIMAMTWSGESDAVTPLGDAVTRRREDTLMPPLRVTASARHRLVLSPGRTRAEVVRQ
jgi:predicted O-methyltransferase YrrM